MQVGTAFTCVAGAVMNFTCISMLWHFVKAGATKQAYEIMLVFFALNGIELQYTQKELYEMVLSVADTKIV